MLGDRVHIPLHADGIGTIQLEGEGFGVVQHLLRGACTAENVQAGDHPGRQGDDQLGRVQWYFSHRSCQPASSLRAWARRAGWKQGLELRVLPSG